uniref:uncharacterized protein si:ch211-139g16.8 isoform X2 n=1 Tax=Scatophagus argus TaxID=75038 RepID=UPI001ED7EE9F|nr:uncharacterized protein si:ch211-139g16.8 isoform X2 [Scatophagus argus]
MQGIIRSFTGCEATNMKWLFWFSLLISYLSVIESMEKMGKAESCLSQPNKVIWQKIGQSVVLPCFVSSHCSAKDWRYEWFSFKENSHFHLKLLDNPLKYRLEGASLHINSLHANDSGIYHCAAVSDGEPAPGAQHVGPGTTLVMKEKTKMVRHIPLWLTFLLLAIYSLVIVILILKKHYCRRTRKIEKNSSTKKRQFRDVLQEMYSRRNLEKNKEAASKVTVRRNHTQEGTSTDLDNSTDDIYQNV